MALQISSQISLQRPLAPAAKAHAVLLPPRTTAAPVAAAGFACSSSSACSTSQIQHLVSYRQYRNARAASVQVRANLIDQIVYAEGYTEVEEVRGIRMVVDENDTTQFEYLIKWKVRSCKGVLCLARQGRHKHVHAAGCKNCIAEDNSLSFGSLCAP